MPRRARPLQVTTLLLRPHLAMAAAQRVRLDDLFAAHGVDPACVDDPEVRVPLRFLNEVWRELGRRLGEPSYGLRLASQHDMKAFEVFGYLLGSAPTVGDSLAATIRFQRLLFEFQPLSLVVDLRRRAA